MDTKTKSDIDEIREAFDRLAKKFSSEGDDIVDLLPNEVGDEWDALLDAIEKAEGRR